MQCGTSSSHAADASGDQRRDGDPHPLISLPRKVRAPRASGVYRQALPPLGWAQETNHAVEHDTYSKTVDGRTVRFVVAADDRGAFTRIWTTYYQGLTLR